MASPQDKTISAVPERSLPRSPVASPWRRRVRSLIFLGLATALHGLVFVVPWPETEQAEVPEPEVLLEPEPPAISVAQLPPESSELASKVTETAEKSTLPNQSTPKPERQTPTRPDPTPQTPEAGTNEPEEDGGDPNISDLPLETGLEQPNSGNPVTVPSLEERLQDPGSYVKDGEPTDALTISVSSIPAWTGLMEVQLGFLPEPITLHPLEFSIDYALSCQNPLIVPPAKGTLGMVLGEDNEILMEPYTLSSSGYSLLDEQAKEKAKEQDIIEQITANKSEPRPGYFTLEFTVNTDSSNCP
ncbi:MAG: hypothetical protein ACFB0C_01640 [Leptolyngbyaceae cyanobacterium]